MMMTTSGKNFFIEKIKDMSRDELLELLLRQSLLDANEFGERFRWAIGNTLRDFIRSETTAEALLKFSYSDNINQSPYEFTVSAESLTLTIRAKIEIERQS